ncbi:carbohydrate sulfotransferase 15-like [Gigantopelta aegis]|uniref:carbohydrate sulfotransferase 15-like n=1 Tax=Gigantopelta aegis TaxID=1735272 RepID=UPI001B8895E4|nr:carbohydrate sulfotransferase 15-like [Gigantopelta aegis]
MFGRITFKSRAVIIICVILIVVAISITRLSGTATENVRPGEHLIKADVFRNGLFKNDDHDAKQTSFINGVPNYSHNHEQSKEINMHDVSSVNYQHSKVVDLNDVVKTFVSKTSVSTKDNGPDSSIFGVQMTSGRFHESNANERKALKRNAIDYTIQEKHLQRIKKENPDIIVNWDVMKMKPISTLKRFKNPCWYESQPLRSDCRIGPFAFIKNVDTATNQQLRCLPYFYIIGQPKCGTTDIYFRLIQHPQIAKPPNKEPFWLNKFRLLNSECSGLNTYLDFFTNAARKIESHYRWKPIHGQGREMYHDMVTGDGTPDTMWDNRYWSELPGNENCSFICVTNADYVHHMTPGAKIIVGVRDPVERLYSDYMYEYLWLHYKPSPEAFHKEVVRMIEEFQQCVTMFSLRRCVYNGTQENSESSVRIRVGIYHVHLEDWLRLFPRDQIHIIRFEDYIHDVRQEMTRLFDFLQLRPVSTEEMKAVLKLPVTNKRPTRKDGAKIHMKPETRDILETFYRPFNEKLAKLLDDKKYLWSKNAARLSYAM